MKPITFDSIKAMYTKRGYKFYENGAFNLNIWAIRSGYETVNLHDDILGVCYYDEFGSPICLAFGGTTKPGLYYLKNKLGNPNGTAILCEGYHKDAFRYGHHRGYPALIQNRQLPVYRDYNKDGKFDVNGKVYRDVTGLNLHTDDTPDFVGGSSAGCQNIVPRTEFEIFMAVVRRSLDYFPNRFSYALFENCE